MITLDATQQGIIDEDWATYSWLFDITLDPGGSPSTVYYSTKNHTYNAHTYLPKIISDKFNGGPQEKRILTEQNVIPETNYDFSITNVDGGLDASDFYDAEILLSLLLKGGKETGEHDGGDDSAILSVSTATWTVDALIGKYIENSTDGSSGIISDNDETTITVTLSGGDNDWDDGDTYVIHDAYEEIIRQWKMYIPTNYVKAEYDQIDITAVDFLQKYLDGVWPNRPLVKDLYPSTDPDNARKQDNLCVPIPIGTCYIPIRSVYIEADATRYYVLGLDSDTYTIDEVRAPRGKGDSVWTSDNFTFTQATKGVYKVFSPVISDSDRDGTADSTGFWLDGDTFMDILVKFKIDRTKDINGTSTGTHNGGDDAALLTDSTASWVADSLIGAYAVNKTDGSYGLITDNTDTTVTATLAGGTGNEWDDDDVYVIGGPASVIRFVLTDSTDGMGVDTADIDDDLFGAAEVIYAGWELTFQGGFYLQQEREFVLTQLLAQCHSTFTRRAKIGLKVLSKTSQKTITTVVKDSFRSDKLERSQNDSGYVAWNPNYAVDDSEMITDSDDRDFENDAGNWIYYTPGYSLAQSDDYSHGGTYSGKITSDADGSKIIALDTADATAFQTGKRYRFSAWIYYPSGMIWNTPANLYIGNIDATILRQVPSNLGIVDEWQYIYTDIYISGEDVDGYVYMYLGYTIWDNQTLYVDDISCVMRSSGSAEDVLIKKLVDADGDTDYPSSDIFNCPLINNSIHAQNLGHLRLQRLLLKDSKQSFKHNYSLVALEPVDTITINNADYGGNYDVMVDSSHIKKELQTEFTTYSFTV